MTISGITGFTPIAENSDATPGLWNARLQQIQDNVNSLWTSANSYLGTPISTNTIQPESGNTVRVVAGKDLVLRSIDSGGQVLNVRALGAVGDGVTNDAPSLNSAAIAAASLGYSLFIPDGTYLCESRLSWNAIPNIYGVPEKTILKAGSSVTTPFIRHNSGALAGSRVRGLKVSGESTSSIVGVYIATDALGTLLDWEDFLISGFSGGAGGRGMRIGNVVQSSVRRGYIQGNYIGLEINADQASLPTTITVSETNVRTSANDGALVQTGYGVVFDRECVFESNASYGLHVKPRSGENAIGVVVRDAWFEQNFKGFAHSSSSRTQGYALKVDGTVGGTAQASVIGGYFNIDSGSEGAIDFDTNSDYVIDGVRLGVSNRTAAIRVRGNGTGYLSNYLSRANGSVLSTVSDANAQLIHTEGRLSGYESAWSRWEPTLRPGGTMSASSTTFQRAQYKTFGKTAFVEVWCDSTFTGTMAATFDVTLPSGVTVKAPDMYTPATIFQGGTAETGYVRISSGTLLTFTKTASFASAAHNGAGWAGSFEIV